jgi:hypothetical protein
VPGRGSVRGGNWLVTPEADRKWLANLPATAVKRATDYGQKKTAADDRGQREEKSNGNLPIRTG